MSRLRPVEGKNNALVKTLRRAFARAELTEDGCCAVEGVHIIEEAIRSGLKFQAVFFSRSAQDVATKLLPQIGGHTDTLLLPDRTFASAVPSESPQGVAALVRIRRFSLEDVLTKAQTGLSLALAGVQDPGNLGTILRSAEAFGAGCVLLGEGTVNPYNSKVVRASAGSLFRLPVVRTKLLGSLAALRKAGLRLIATSSHKGTLLPEANLAGPVGIFIGSESAGLPRNVLAEMDETVCIPHSPKVESLNAAVAASIVLYQYFSPRRQGSTENTS